MKQKNQHQSGQALVILLVFMVVGIVMTTMAVAIVIVNATAASQIELGEDALKLAESSAENAVLRLLRNPSFNQTETLTLGGGTAVATISGTNPITIVATGTIGSYVR